MLDPNCFRQFLQETARALKKRGFVLEVEKIAALEAERKTAQTVLQELQQVRNELSKKIGQAKARGEDTAKDLQTVNETGEKLAHTQESFDRVSKELSLIIESTPNIPEEVVPEGRDEKDNVVISSIGEKPSFSFTAKDHVDLGEAKGWFDFETSTKLSGARFVVMKGQLAKLHRALAQFMLNTHINEHGYEEVYVPYLVNSASLFGTGQLPKFREDQFRIEDDQDRWLIPTAEVPVTNFMRDVVTSIDRLPMKFVAHTPCFRSEVGSYGKDKRGMFRQHQFDKVELVVIAHPDQSQALHESLTGHAEAILQKLKLPYRKVLLCGGDLGFSSAKTYDLEVWLPGQQQYREISSCSQFKDFQARRLKARFRNPETNKPELVHTLNGSGLAVGRTLIAVMENYQDAEGNIHIPEVLQPYMGNQCVI